MDRSRQSRGKFNYAKQHSGYRRIRIHRLAYLRRAPASGLRRSRDGQPLQQLAGIDRARRTHYRKTIPFIEADVRDRGALDAILREHRTDAAIHFAGLKAVGESVAKPLLYYENNVAGTVTLLQALSDANIKRIVFSSSATVYGDPESVPLSEDARLSPTNPYGHSKHQVEQILIDLAHGDAEWRAGILRYFNPVGAHTSGMIGEDPRGTPNNLMPFVAQVA